MHVLPGSLASELARAARLTLVGLHVLPGSLASELGCTAWLTC